MNLHELVDKANQLEADGKEDSALDLLWNHFGYALQQGRFTDVDELFATLDVKTCGLHVLMGLLTISTSVFAKKKLPARAAFAQKVWHHFKTLGVNMQELSGLL